jgi:hypothetical protein
LVDVRGTKILRKVHKTRAIDGKTMVLGKILDHDNAYKYKRGEQEITLTPAMWIILEVQGNGVV